MATVLPDGMKWCAPHNIVFAIDDTCYRCDGEAVSALNLTSCDFVGDAGCTEPTCEQCHGEPPPASDALKLAREAVEDDTGAVSERTWLLARAVIEQSEQIERLTGVEPCPCFHTKPCSDMCSCVHPTMSAGCERCCTHGSNEQRKAKAERLAGQSEQIAELKRALGEALGFTEGNDYLEPDDLRRIDELRRLATP